MHVSRYNASKSTSFHACNGILARPQCVESAPAVKTRFGNGSVPPANISNSVNQPKPSANKKPAAPELNGAGKEHGSVTKPSILKSCNFPKHDTHTSSSRVKFNIFCDSARSSTPLYSNCTSKSFDNNPDDDTTSDSSEDDLRVDQNGYLKTIPKVNRNIDRKRRTRPGKMADNGKRPSLKLTLSGLNKSTTDGIAQSPAPQSAIARTPSIKLNLKTPGTPAPILKFKQEKSEINGAASPASSSKKRKRQPGDDTVGNKTAVKQKLTLKTSIPAVQTPKTPGTSLKLKTKGKIPKRPLGVGYDSELDDREQDPMILEGLVLRMQPGPDCDYLRKALENGTVGISQAQGGADVRMRFLDTGGRRGLITVNGHQYATSVVDLPCIIEGMKSWDKKGWMKSIDISQMMIVLGRCNTDNEAKNYQLPEGVDPKTYAYAHGLTAPMKWVRKRRFGRTRRARVDDIESIERKVQQLLAADRQAISSSYQVLDHDPRQDEYSPEEDSDQDAEAEDDADYFNSHDVYGNGAGATPSLAETPAEPAIRQDEIDEFELAFANDDDDDGATAAGESNVGNHHRVNPSNALAPPEQDSSNAVSPAAISSTSAAPTPAGEADDDDDESEGDSDRDEEEKDADDNLAQVKERIADIESKIREQSEQLKKATNHIIKRKIAQKIQNLRQDVTQMKKSVGLVANDDDDEDDDGDGDQ